MPTRAPAASPLTSPWITAWRGACTCMTRKAMGWRSFGPRASRLVNRLQSPLISRGCNRWKLNSPNRAQPESMMLKIGEFSRLSQVTIKTLHHYDEIGLLKPAQVDPFTDYRYYTVDQLPRLHSIMALKELGLSLEEIARLLLDDLPPEQIRGMFRLKQAEAQPRVPEDP